MDILIDTNVVSELMKLQPNPAVAAWRLNQDVENLYFSAMGEAELRFGAAKEKDEDRQRRRINNIDSFLQSTFAGRILTFTQEDTYEYADIRAIREAIGRPVDDDNDLQMAAVARSKGMAIATRNVRDFDYVSLKIINPWDEVIGVREPQASYGFARAA